MTNSNPEADFCVDMEVRQSVFFDSPRFVAFVFDENPMGVLGVIRVWDAMTDGV